MKENYPQDNERFWDAVLEKDIKDVLNKEYPSMFLVATLNESIVGFGCYLDFQSLNRYKISWMNISPNMQGKGIGRLLVKELEKCIMENSTQNFSIILETDKPVFYKKLGYKKYGKNKDNDLMKKVLNKSPKRLSDGEWLDGQR